MLDIPNQSKEGLQQLGIDIKTKLQGKPLSEAPQVLQEPTEGVYQFIKLIIAVFICGMIAGIGYLLVTNPAGFLTWLIGLGEAFMDVIR